MPLIRLFLLIAYISFLEIAIFSVIELLRRKRTETKMPWTEAEDEVLRRLVAHHGDRNWSTMVEHLPSRSAKQIRERWHNQLDPKIRKTPWTEKVRASTAIFGDIYLMAHHLFTGRSDNHVGSSGTGQQVCRSLALVVAR